MQNGRKNEIRDLRNGDWYWIPKKVIREYLPLIGSTGIAVYNFLASLADKSQTCFPSQKYIARRLGFSRATISRTLKRLQAAGLIRVDKRTRYHCVYSLMKVKTRCRARETQMSHRRNSDVSPENTNNNKITRNINKNVNGNIKISTLKSHKRINPRTKEELLAFDIAKALNDFKSYRFYFSLARRYDASLLKRILGEVKEIPQNKIKKSRAALFNHLIKNYASENHKNHRH
jgi:biotin operon repressor